LQYAGTEHELVVRQSVFTQRGVDRILKYASELASSRPARHLSSATKSNGIVHSMPYWDERFAQMARSVPDVTTDQYHIDTLTTKSERKHTMDPCVSALLDKHTVSDKTRDFLTAPRGHFIDGAWVFDESAMNRRSVHRWGDQRGAGRR
jgi:hypothetical protein